MAIDREAIRLNGFPKGIRCTVELMKSLSEKQNMVLSEFSDVAKEYNLLLEKRNLCRTAQPNTAGLIGFPDGTIAICMNDADREKAIKLHHERLKKSYKTIVSVIDEALNCGLGDLEIIQKYCQKFNVKP